MSEPHAPLVSAAELGAVVAIVVAIVAVVAWQPDQAVLVIGFGVTTLTGLLAFLRSLRVEVKVEATAGDVQKLEVKVDGRLTQLLEETRVSNQAIGRDEQRATSEQTARDLIETNAPAPPSGTADDPMHTQVVNDPTKPIPVAPVPKPPAEGEG